MPYRPASARLRQIVLHRGTGRFGRALRVSEVASLAVFFMAHGAQLLSFELTSANICVLQRISIVTQLEDCRAGYRR